MHIFKNFTVNLPNVSYSQFETQSFCNTIVTQGARMHWIRIDEGTQKIFWTRCDYRVWEIQFLKPACLWFGWAYRSGEGCCLLEVELILKQQDTHTLWIWNHPLSESNIVTVSREDKPSARRGKAGSVECKQLTDSPPALSRLQLTRDRVYSITSPQSIRVPCCDPLNFQACNYKPEICLKSPNPSIHI